MKSTHDDNCFYTKQNGKYVKCYETPRLFCDGIWIVQTKPNVRGQQCIMKIGDLTSVFPFADLAQHSDDLAEFIRLWEDSKNRHSPRGVYSLAILKFISMTSEEKKLWLNKLKEETEDNIVKYHGC